MSHSIPTLFHSNNRHLAEAARLENYHRAILWLEQSIEQVGKKADAIHKYIAKIQAERQTADEKRVRQIDVDIAYLEKVLQSLQPESSIEKYTQQLIEHKKHFAELKVNGLPNQNC